MAICQPAELASECVVELMTTAPCRVSLGVLMKACHERATEGQFGTQDPPAEEWMSKLPTAPGRPTAEVLMQPKRSCLAVNWMWQYRLTARSHSACRQRKQFLLAELERMQVGVFE
jgi:hypothetical protein